MAKKSFKKYEYEGIRTDYQALNTPASEKIESRNVVELSDGAIAIANETIDNETVFMLAEDVKKGDLGFVYYIIENEDNLIDEGDAE